MRRVILATGGALLVSSSLAMADVVGAGASVSYWDSNLSGQAGNKGDFVDLENDLDLSGDGNANLEAYLEHPVPVLPNVRLNYTTIEQSGSGQLSTGFDGLPSGDVTSDLDLTQADITLYYEILDNWANIDVGLTARNLDGELVVRETTGTLLVSRTEISGVVPMGYLALRADLPFTGVSLGGQLNAISFDGDSISDVNVYGQYEIAILRLQAGYRQIKMDYEDSDNLLDVTLKGPYASVGITF